MNKDHNHIELQKAVEDRFGQKVNSKSRCEDLRISIQSTINQPIGLNTIRRFFGLIKHENQLSKTILDLLSKYVGFINYESFLANELSVEGEEKHLILNQVVSSSKIPSDLLKNLSIKTLDAFEKLILLNSTKLSVINNVVFEFYDSDSIWSEPAFCRSRYHVSQLISGVVSNVNVQEQRDVLGRIVEAKYGKEYFHLFPPMDFHEGINWKLFDEFYNPSTEQEKVFKYSLLALGAYKTKNANDFKKYHLSIDHFPKNGHSLLFGRLLGLKILEAEIFKSPLEIKTLVKLTKARIRNLNSASLNFSLEVQFSVIYVLHSFAISNQLNSMVEYLQGIELKDLLVSDYWSSNVNNHIKIYFSIYQELIGNTNHAKGILQSVNPNLFPAFERKTQLQVYELASDLVRK